ncbi:hypothetical protein EV363DRAFT_1325789 [Boletus edulis]|nr:hypothetical protein EV363DRAFT_1325789 [Boletus edulis]
MDSTSFTFLATILVLVLLSASLVLRSYLLRRRYRQHFQQALADGLFADLDPTGQFDAGFRRSARRLGPKPVVWDTWIHPADKDDTWSSIIPVAVRCSPLPSPPSTPISLPQPSSAPPGSPSSLPTQSRMSVFSQLRIPSPLLLSPRPSLPLPGQPQSPVWSPTLFSTRSPSAAPISPQPSIRSEKDAATIALSVLIAMPDPSAPVYRPTPNTKGKSADPLESPGHQPIGDKDPLLPTSSRRPVVRTSDEGLPLLEFGVVEATTGEWVWEPES